MKSVVSKITFAMLGLLIASLATSSELAAQQQSWDTRCVPGDTFFHAGFNIESLLKLEPEDSEIRKLLTDTARLEWGGINFNDLRQFQILLGGEVTGNLVDVLEVKILFNKDQDFDSILNKMFRQKLEKAEHDGKRFYRSSRQGLPVAYTPDKRTFILTLEPRVKAVISAETGEGRIADMMADAEASSDVFIAFEYNDTLAKVIGGMAEIFPDLPIDGRDLAKEARRGQLTLALRSNELLSAKIEAKNAEGAERLKRAIEALVVIGKLGIPKARAQLELMQKVADEEPRENSMEMLKSASKGLDVAEAALIGATVEAKESNVELRVTLKRGDAESAQALLRMVYLLGKSVFRDVEEF